MQAFVRRGIGVAAVVLLASPGCYRLRDSAGGGQVDAAVRRRPNPDDIVVPEGYRVEVVAQGLTYPTGVAFDERGRPHVVEAGYSYGEDFETPRLLRVEQGGRTVEVARGEHPPWNGIVFDGTSFIVAEGGTLGGGRIVRIQPDGAMDVLVADLPSLGDHQTNGPALGPDGKIYFAIGTATNSAIVGPDNWDYGWLERHPDFHDIPAKDVVLTGENFVSGDPLTDDPDDRVTTGAFLPFGVPSKPGQVIEGAVPCSGCVMRIDPAGGEIELVGWGFRNPYGLAFTPEGTLIVSDNSYDVRGSRPIWGTGDLLWKVEEEGLWYGWPDYWAHVPLGKNFGRPGDAVPRRLLREHPNEPPHPAAILAVHSSSNGFDIADERFGYEGRAFVAQFGDMAPAVGKTLAPVGYKVVRVELDTGVIHPFAFNRGEKNGPASLLGTGGFERPNSVRFGPDGALYVVDFGVVRMDEQGAHPVAGTGVLWRIVPEQARTALARRSR